MTYKRKGPKPVPPEERFWRYVQKDLDGCWRWQGFINRKTGYGQFCPDRSQLVGAHRYSFQLAFGGLLLESVDFVCHTCHNRACVNPAHLYKGSAKSNSEDIKRAGRPIGRPRRAI